MTDLEAFILGLIQGLTEFLPVSSSGHLVVLQTLLGAEQQGILVEIVVHVATLASVLIFYRRRVGALIAGALRGDAAALGYGLKLGVATLPAVALVLIAGDFLDGLFELPAVAGVGFLVTGLILWSTRATAPAAKLATPGWGAALLIGCAQALAIVPGISRSGATVAAALALGVAPVAAAEFSFLMSVISISAAALRALPELGAAPAGVLAPLAIAGASALVFGIAAIWLFVRLLQTRGFHYFAYYVWALGLAVVLAGLLAAPAQAAQPSPAQVAQPVPAQTAQPAAEKAAQPPRGPAAQPSPEALARVPEALPSAPPLAPATRAKLASALASRPADYRPRTRNRHPDGSPMYSNRLLLEASPYLQQHAHNPVDWYPWGDEAFAAAARLGRPVFLSIGYSTCHWCHVMEEESFDSVAVASYLNEHFVSIKVDREARPDIDAVYMAAVLALGKSGGWPLSVWLTPDREAFFGGTYFPPHPADGRPGFLDVLRKVNEAYANERAKIATLSKQVTRAVELQLAGQSALQSRIPEASVFQLAFALTARAADRQWGGVRGNTKFPSSVPLRFLLRHHRRTGEKDALTLATLALEKMAAGGIHDQIGGGFHRYATDNRWLVPHFEKMLYDNAQLAVIYLEAAQLTGREDFAAVSRSTLEYLAREMTSSDGAFHSATDADSTSDSGEAEEGWFYTWTPAEIEAAVGAELARIVSAYYGVTPNGNFEGRNILHTWRSRAQVAEELAISEAALDAALARARPLLFEARSRRPPPLRDEKIIASWNGLAIGAFARAGLVFGEPRYVQAAARAAAFILDEMQSADGALRRVHLGGRAEGPAFLEDYAFLIAGLLDLYEVDSQPRWLRAAIALQATLDAHYLDELGGGYFQAAAGGDALLVREKPSRDGALPSGNSVAALNLLRLAELTGDHRYSDAVIPIFSAFSELMDREPTAVSEMLLALDFYLSKRVEIVFITPPDGAGLDAMLAPVRSTFFPNRVLVAAPEDDRLEGHAELNPLLQDRIARNGRTTAYLCENFVCGFPTADPATFAEQLAAAAAPSPLPPSRLSDTDPGAE